VTPSPYCAWPGCTRSARRNISPYAPDLFCSAHDAITNHGDVCHCPTARPVPCGECHRCARAVVGLWPAAHYLAAIKAYPSLLDQQVDWTLRHIRGRPDGLDLEQLDQAGAA
jgi:hypothetical protein